MHLLRQSTVATVTVGPVLDSTGAAVTTAVVGDFKISKNGTSSTLSGATVTHDANGYYNIALTTGNTDTAGRFVIYSGNTAHSMGAHRFTVLLPSVFDALITNATNATGGLPTATGAISALAGAIPTLLQIEGSTVLAKESTLANRPTLAQIEASSVLAKEATASSILSTVGDIPTANQNRDAVLNADPNAGYTDGSFGDRLLISDNNNRTVKVTGAGSGHVAADLHASQTDSLTADAITAAAVTKIQNGLALEASSQSILARIGAFTGTGVNTVLGFFRALLRSDAGIATPSDVGGTFNHTTDSTQAIRDRGDAAWTTGAGGGGSATVNVLPYTGAVPDRVEGTTIKVFYNERTNVSVGVTDATGTAVTLDAKTLRFCVEDRYGADVLTLNDGDITRSGSTFTVQIPQSLTDTVGANYRWSLRDLTGSLNTVLIHGQMIVAEAAEDEA